MVGCHKAVAERKLEWCVTDQIGARVDVPSQSIQGQSIQGQSIQGQPIRDNQIHLWLVDVQKLLDPEVSAKYGQLLTESEIMRAQRISNQAHRQRYLGGRLGLRILLSGYTGIANAELKFGYGKRGKPKLLNTISVGTLEFNYTLSHRFALYSFSLNRALGVDLEIFPRTVATAHLAKRILTDLEQTTWRTLQKEQHNEAMLACWTRKEAYGKVLGVGIRYVMNQVNLFTGLQQDRWRTKISGLFGNEAGKNEAGKNETVGNEAGGEIRPLFGIQLELPVPGVASLMYSETADRFNVDKFNADKINADKINDVAQQDTGMNIEPELRAFRLAG